MPIFSAAHVDPPPSFGTVSSDLVDALRFATDPSRVLWTKDVKSEEGEAIFKAHSVDKSPHPSHSPDVIVWPKSTEEISAIVKLCAAMRIPITPVGTLTGLEGGGIPFFGGVSLDLSRFMTNVLELHENELQVTAQAGIKKSVLGAWLGERGYRFFPDPGSDSSIGGQASTGASGTTSVKYGTFKENVVTMKAVLPDGSILNTRTRTRKSSTGYDLTHLLMGAEGTLGVITQLTLRIAPVPRAISAAVVGFDDLAPVAKTVADLMRRGLSEMARCEVMNSVAVNATNLQYGLSIQPRPTLFLEFHGQTEVSVEAAAAAAREIAESNGGMDFAFTSNEEEREQLWVARRGAYFASLKVLRNEPGLRLFSTDVCVPIASLADLMLSTEADFKQTEGNLPCSIVGHVADGNFQ